MSLRRQIGISCVVLAIILTPLAAAEQMMTTPEQPLRLLWMLPAFLGALWLLKRKFSIAHESKSESRRLSSTDELRSRSVEDRLDELERLKRRDMVTAEEYVAKAAGDFEGAIIKPRHPSTQLRMTKQFKKYPKKEKHEHRLQS